MKIGDIVHYVAYGTPQGEYKPECRAAIVTRVHEDPDPANPATVQPGGTRRIGELDLCVVTPDGSFFNKSIPQNEPIKPGGTWHRADHE